MTEPTEPGPFETLKYQIDRAHELELNKFTHALEVERLKILFLLNGGAATAWFTFAKDRIEGLSGFYTLLNILGPVAFWLGGLFGAARAAHWALTTQRGFTRAYHQRRRAAEHAWLAGSPTLPADEAGLRRGLGTRPEESLAQCYQRLADTEVDRARADGDKVNHWIETSLYLFGFGAVSAAASFFSGVPAWLDALVQRLT